MGNYHSDVLRECLSQAIVWMVSCNMKELDVLGGYAVLLPCCELCESSRRYR